MKKLFCTTLLLLTIAIGFAQGKNDLWKKSNSFEAFKKTPKNHLPQKNIFKLDLLNMEKMLNKAPKRANVNITQHLIITLPNGEGVLENFKVFENSVMEPELAKKYPNIKSYVAVGVDNPLARAYFSYSPLGFKSMILYPDQSSVFIEPISDNSDTYSVYKKSDKEEVLEEFECNIMHKVANTTTSDNTVAFRGADDAKLRTFRIALSSTGEYSAYFGGTKANTLAAMNNTLTRINGIFEKDFGVRLILIGNNDAIIYTNSTTDPYSDPANKSNWRLELQSNLTATIGEANYDIGHLLGTGVANSGDAGCVGCICTNNFKGRGYTTGTSNNHQGDTFDLDFVAHEIGHQLGATHTFTHTSETGTGSQMEPGSGSTIMSYSGRTSKDIEFHSDAYFHAISIQQVTDNIKTKTCAVISTNGNAAPIVNAGLDFTIPKGTPFMLTGTATDANSDDILTYSWEQMDLGTSTTSVPNATATSGPLFRSYPESTSATRYFPNINSILNGLTTTTGREIASEVLPNVARTLNFRFTARDNRIGGGSNNSDDMIITVDGLAGPFTIDSQNTAVSYAAGTSQTINWSVAGTNTNGVNCTNVDILLSTDGGQTFPIVLLASTPNDGSQNIIIPNMPGTTNRIMVKGSNHIFFDVNNSNFTITGSNTDTTAPTTSTLTASGTTTSSTNLSWTAATDNVGVSGYDVYQNGVLRTSTTTTTLSITGLTASTTYNFYVKAKDAAGNASQSSNTVLITTLSNTTLVTTPSYCSSVGGTSKEYINRVIMGTIDNNSGNDNGYGNYTTLSSTVYLGSSEKITIIPKWTSSVRAESYNVWIDFNKNGNFESNELVFSKSKSRASSITGAFTIPSNALTGATRMRVSMKYNSFPSACETFANGEVEDYTINITSTIARTSEETNINEETKEETNEISKLDFKLYPNPVKGDIVNFTEMNESTTYRIFNQMGQQVASGYIENNSVNVGALMPAIYIIEITDGKSVGTKRFIKE